mmetsp:Transcript_5633/g.14091  ORF Transcript_5633/g.14091 Transcript_5633/m.14091 type:complete len:221 (+) Transcript_5633:464-1126(+)
MRQVHAQLVSPASHRLTPDERYWLAVAGLRVRGKPHARERALAVRLDLLHRAPLRSLDPEVELGAVVFVPARGAVPFHECHIDLGDETRLPQNSHARSRLGRGGRDHAPRRGSVQIVTKCRSHPELCLREPLQLPVMRLIHDHDPAASPHREHAIWLLHARTVVHHDDNPPCREHHAAPPNHEFARRLRRACGAVVEHGEQQAALRQKHAELPAYRQGAG